MPQFGKKRTGVEPAAPRWFQPLTRRD